MSDYLKMVSIPDGWIDDRPPPISHRPPTAIEWTEYGVAQGWAQPRKPMTVEGGNLEAAVDKWQQFMEEGTWSPDMGINEVKAIVAAWLEGSNE